MSTNDSKDVVVVIPTRNRADLAINAIRSVLDQGIDGGWLIVSDNSTAESEKTALADFCRELSNPRLRYVAPPAPLAMTEHWNWAMQHALQLPEVDRFIYLTDRSMFKPGELAAIIRIAELNPDKVVSYESSDGYD